MDTTTNTTTETGTTLTASMPWSEAGALVIREHTEQRGWSLAEPIAADPDLNAVDQGFTTFVTRYAQRRGHLPFGAVFEMAEAWGIEVEGDYALCSAHDPNCVLWPRSSSAYLSNLIYLLQHDPDTLGAHEIDPDHDMLGGNITPALKSVDVALYNTKQPQTEPRWLPAVLCAERDGLGAKTLGADDIGDALGSLFASLMGAGDGEAPEVKVSFAVVDSDGNISEVKSLSDLMGAREGQPEHQA